MHPAFSVIFFTVASGTGYGLLFLLGIGLALDPQRIGCGTALAMLALGTLLTTAGLLASMLHLGQPQRAWRAFSQWRSSWLSREGVAALASFAPIALTAWLLWRGADATALRPLGLVMALCATITVFCTARIYTSLKTIHAWHNPYVLPVYLLLGLLGGAAWVWTIAALGGSVAVPHIAQATVFALAAMCAWTKWRYWRFIDTTAPVATIESATGLGRFGAVRSVEAPHTEENYLTQEMGFVLARKHSARLRRISLMLLGVAPVALALIALLANTALTGAFCSIAAALCTAAGSCVERWLFFAEAKHAVMLYYGRDAAQRA